MMPFPVAPISPAARRAALQEAQAAHGAAYQKETR